MWIGPQDSSPALPLSGVARSLTSGAIGTERLRDILQLIRRPVEVELGATYVEIGVRSFGRGLFLKEPIPGAELGRKRVFWVEPGDLVISNVFAWEGAVGIAADEHAGTIGSHRFMTFGALTNDVNVGFLRWFFATAEGVALLAAASPGSAGRNRTLAIERFLDLEVPLPDRESQATVVDLANRLTPVIGIGDQRRQLADAVVPSALNRALAGLA